MAKANSPIRLDQSLMDAAAATAHIAHRSTAEQIEFWADIGKTLDRTIGAAHLLALKTGSARIKIEPVTTGYIDPDNLLAALDANRDNGALTSRVTTSQVRYQASQAHPGRLEQIQANGDRVIGRFVAGVFIPEKDPAA